MRRSIPALGLWLWTSWAFAFTTAPVADLSATATLDFANIVAAPACAADLTVTVTGAALGNTVAIGVPNGSVVNASTIVWGWVSSANTVTVRYCILTGANQDAASGTFRVDVFQQ